MACQGRGNREAAPNHDIIVRRCRDLPAPPLRLEFRVVTNVQQVRRDGQNVSLFLGIHERGRIGDGRHVAANPNNRARRRRVGSERFGGKAAASPRGQDAHRCRNTDDRTA